ncbi:DNA alkylation repair protein [Paracoccus sp. SY]|uniref:DNA alkylation repair protein n=1 Tax=Paracoccus sp. SY TaxID=1330255 RepID=UPI000CD1D436|nr:DNA alkylation repair protein [Paracoccus sp. SY]
MTELDSLKALADPEKADQMQAYHKTPRVYLGVANPHLDDLVAEWRASRDIEGRIDLARDLWASDIHEARIAAAKLLTQARIRPDDAVWSLIAGWAAEFDGWAIADSVMIAGQKRLVADPSRLDQVETWLDHPNKWTRRAALVGTLPWAKMNNPKPDELGARERILDWAARLADDRDWFIQKAIAWWLRDLSKRDAPRVRAFLEAHGARMKPFARKEALRLAQDR